MPSNRLLILLVFVLIGGCSRDRDSDFPMELRESSLPGVYAGVFPCDGCPGMPTTLWLRADGRFFIRQTYPETDGREASNAYNLGRWRWVAGDRVLLLEGAGPRRTFTRPDRDMLDMRTDSDLEHRLARDTATPDFSATIRMTGMMRKRGNSAMFTECLTGLVAPVNTGREFTRFLHQYQSVGARDEPTYVELEGRFIWSDDGAPNSLTIDRFITVKASGAC